MKIPFFQTNRPKESSSPVPQPTPSTATAPTFSRPPIATQTPPQQKPPSNAPSYIQFRLRSLIDLVPDKLLAYPRNELPQHVNLDDSVKLPTDLILPQLATARVTLPMAIVLDALPTNILANPLPLVDAESITLPLHEVVAQLSPNFFSARLRPRSGPELQSLVADIPAPFQERNPAPPPTVTPPPEPEPPVAIKPPEVPLTPPPPPPPAAPIPPPPERVSIPPQPTPVPTPVPSPSEPGILDENKFLIDINRCTVEDLLAIKGIGRSLAQRIIEHRTQRGRFQSLDDLRQVPGVGRKTFRTLAGAKPQSLNRLLGVPDEHELTLQEIVRLTGKMPGLQGCMLATSDGLFLAGELPPHLDPEAISVFAPQLFKRVTRYTKELKVGAAHRFTLFTDEQPVSIFGAEDVFLVVIHDKKHFSKRLLRHCERISQEIARLCRQRTTV